MDFVVVRGAGDLATGVIQKLHRAGFNVAATDIPKPTSVRRLVSLSECIYTSEFTVEDITAKRVSSPSEIEDAVRNGFVPVIVDPDCSIVHILKPFAIVDAIIAKKNLGTSKSMAGITIALGPGFTAPDDVDCVIETMRGHDLGRLIFNGSAQPNTGVPGLIGGKAAERVLRSETGGILKTFRQIGNIVNEGELICEISGDETEKVTAPIDGVLRGLMRDGMRVVKGTKLGDIDPRTSETGNCGTISDKARNLGGAVLEALMYLKKIKSV